MTDLLYFLVFPVDAWREDTNPGWQETKRRELFPIMVLLLPLISLYAGLSNDFGFFGNLLLALVQGCLLAAAAIPYLKLKGGFGDLAINFTASLLILAFLWAIIPMLFGLFSDLDFDFDID